MRQDPKANQAAQSKEAQSPHAAGRQNQSFARGSMAATVKSTGGRKQPKLPEALMMAPRTGIPGRNAATVHIEARAKRGMSPEPEHSDKPFLTALQGCM